jgi:hypothetical protein
MSKALKIFGLLLIVSTAAAYVANTGGSKLAGSHFLSFLFGCYLFLTPKQKLRPFSPPSLKSLLKCLGTVLFLALVLFVFQFWRFREFGLYERDFSTLVPAFDWNGNALIAHMEHLLFFHFSPDSAGELVMAVIGFFGYPGMGLPGIYLLSMSIPLANSSLFYLIIRKLTRQDLAAYFGALLYIFFPPFRTPQFLFLTFSTQVGLMLMLCSFHAFLKDRRLLFEICMFGSVLFAKEFAPLFLFFPLFQLRTFNKDFWRRWLKHLAFTGVSLLLIIVLTSMHLSRAALLDSAAAFLLTPFRFFLAFTTGGLAGGFFNFTLSPLTLLGHFSTELLLIFILGLILFTRLFLMTKPSKQVEKRSFSVDNALVSLDITLSSDPHLFEPLRIGAISFVMLVFSFTGFNSGTPINVTNASGSLTYLVSALPMILLFTCAFLFILLIPKPTYQNLVLILLTAGFLSTLGVDRFHLQERMIQAWRTTQWLWSNILSETQPLSEETFLIIEYNLKADETEMALNDLHLGFDQNLLNALIRPPAAWDNFPRVEITQTQLNLSEAKNLPEGQRVIRMIILNGVIQSEEIHLAESGPASGQLHLADLEKKPLYDLLITEQYINQPLDAILEKEP